MSFHQSPVESLMRPDVPKVASVSEAATSEGVEARVSALSDSEVMALLDRRVQIAMSLTEAAVCSRDASKVNYYHGVDDDGSDLADDVPAVPIAGQGATANLRFAPPSEGELDTVRPASSPVAKKKTKKSSLPNKKKMPKEPTPDPIPIGALATPAMPMVTRDSIAAAELGSDGYMVGTVAEMMERFGKAVFSVTVGARGIVKDRLALRIDRAKNRTHKVRICYPFALDEPIELTSYKYSCDALTNLVAKTFHPQGFAVLYRTLSGMGDINGDKMTIEIRFGHVFFDKHDSNEYNYADSPSLSLSKANDIPKNIYIRQPLSMDDITSVQLEGIAAGPLSLRTESNALAACFTAPMETKTKSASSSSASSGSTPRVPKRKRFEDTDADELARREEEEDLEYDPDVPIPAPKKRKVARPESASSTGPDTSSRRAVISVLSDDEDNESASLAPVPNSSTAPLCMERVDYSIPPPSPSPNGTFVSHPDEGYVCVDFSSFPPLDEIESEDERSIAPQAAPAPVTPPLFRGLKAPRSQVRNAAEEHESESESESVAPNDGVQQFTIEMPSEYIDTLERLKSGFLDLSKLAETHVTEIANLQEENALVKEQNQLVKQGNNLLKEENAALKQELDTLRDDIARIASAMVKKQMDERFATLRSELARCVQDDFEAESTQLREMVVAVMTGRSTCSPAERMAESEPLEATVVDPMQLQPNVCESSTQNNMFSVNEPLALQLADEHSEAVSELQVA